MKYSLLIIALTSLFGYVALAQEPLRLDVAFSVARGRYLVDSQSRPLYVYLPDEQGPASTCSGECAEAWPPLTSEGTVDVDSSAQAPLVGSTTREDGTSQVTYNGWPLYTYAQDTDATPEGQGANGTWFLIDADGNPVGVAEAGDGDVAGDSGHADDAAAEEAALPDGVDVEVMEQGREIYESVASPPCSSCHMTDGSGGAGPRLVGSPILDDPSRLMDQIADGGQFMPAYGDQLSDAQIEAVATYVRNSWGNAHGPLNVSEDAAH